MSGHPDQAAVGAAHARLGTASCAAETPLPSELTTSHETGRPVRFELTEVTRQAVDEYLHMSGRKPGERLFPGRRGIDI